jgi:plasmid maintenance system antidote protein VapI
MTKDERYMGVKQLIESGHITEFKQIFTYLPKTVLAGDLGTNNNRMTRLINNVHEFTLEELDRISQLIDVSYDSINLLVNNQYKKSKHFKRK